MASEVGDGGRVRFSPLQKDVIKKIERLDTAVRVTAIASLALFALTVVFLGLSQAGYIHPVAGLISFCAIFPLLLIIKILDCCQDSIAHNRIDIKSYREMQVKERERNAEE